MINIRKNPVKVQLTNRMLRFFPVVLMASASLVAMVKPSQAEPVILMPNSHSFSINGMNNPSSIGGLQPNSIRMPETMNNLSERSNNTGNGLTILPIDLINSMPANPMPGVANLLTSPAASSSGSTLPETQPRVASPKIIPDTQPGDVNPNADPDAQPQATNPKTSSNTQPRVVSPKANPDTQPGAANPETQPQAASLSASPAVNSQISVIFTRCYSGAPSTEPEWRNWMSADNMDYLFQPDRRKQRECRR